MSKKERPKCRDCDAEENIHYGPDPFDEDVRGEINHCWLCKDCYDELIRAI
jgi:hypothetical protein